MEVILKDSKNKYVKLHKHEICKGQEHLEEEMKRITGMKGEGVMLRDPKSKYEYRRVETMLKVKEFIDDEATVIGKEFGSGRCENMMGALVCKNK